MNEPTRQITQEQHDAIVTNVTKAVVDYLKAKSAPFNDLIQALIVLVTDFRKFTDEKRDLDAREKQAREDITSAAALGPLVDPAVARKVSAANGVLDSVNARRAHVDKRLQPIVAKMRGALREADQAWTRIVRANGDALEARFYQSNARFYGDDERECRRQMNHETLPAWNDNNRALWHGHAGNLTEANAIQTIGHFIRQVEANCGRLNIIICDTP